jgi:hypothetical protein
MGGGLRPRGPTRTPCTSREVERQADGSGMPALPPKADMCDAAGMSALGQKRTSRTHFVRRKLFYSLPRQAQRDVPKSRL